METKTPVAGRGGSVRVGCTCDALTSEQCKCPGAQKLALDNWQVDPSDDDIGFVCVNFPKSFEMEFEGEWLLSPEQWNHIRRHEARLQRRARKRQRRYEHQKRKQ